MSAEVVRDPQTAAREALIAWAVSFGLIVAAFLIYRPAAKAVATAAFLYLPLWFARKYGEDARDDGLRLDRWRTDLILAAKVIVILLPAFFLAFYLFVRLLPHLPPPWLKVLTPLGKPYPHFTLTFPPAFGSWVVDQLFVVALPEEFFYRGFVQRRLREAWPDGRMLWGVRLGRAFFVTALLFALGHLAVFQVWRLAVFFPALLFGWMRERTGTVMAAALVHAFCNLYEMVLEASFF